MENSAKAKFKNIFGKGEKEHILNITDAKLSTDDGWVFDVHKVILARNNDYFCHMFCSISGKDRTEFAMHGVCGKVLNDILVYLYTGKIFLTNENITDILIAADYLLVDALLKEVEKSIHKHLSKNNCVPVLNHAHKINCAYIFNAAFRFIQFHFDSVVFNHKALIAELPLEVLNKILSSKNLYISDETPVWLAIAEWVQKDLQKRLPFVPLLLGKHLAKKDMDETLAKEIMSHSIVGKNPFCRVPNNYEAGYLPALQDFLSIHSDHFFDHRIPKKLTVIVKRVYNKEIKADNSYIYVTLDENLDFWYKIAEIHFYPEYCASMNHNLYLFRSFGSCVHLNLKDNSVTHRFSFDEILSVGKLGRCICVLTENDEIKIHLFDPEENLLKTSVPYYDVTEAVADSISGNLYVIGNSTDTNKIIAQVYNPEGGIDTWSLIQPPVIDRGSSFFGIYHKKLFAIGGLYGEGGNAQTVEIFEPDCKVWRQVADITMPYSIWMKTVVWEDKLFVLDYSKKFKMKAILWKEPQECWEEVDEIPPLLYTDSYRFCEIFDEAIVRMLSKVVKNRSLNIERSDFC